MKATGTEQGASKVSPNVESLQNRASTEVVSNTSMSKPSEIPLAEMLDYLIKRLSITFDTMTDQRIEHDELIKKIKKFKVNNHES